MTPIPGRQMLLDEILVNPSVPPEDELRLSKQAMKIYEKLRGRKLYGGWVNTDEMAEIARQYGARLNEIRRALIPLGLIVGPPEKRDNLNWYTIILLDDAPKKWLHGLKVY